MPISHHSHSGQFCAHASGSLEEMVQSAIRKGFRVYGLTEHVPRYRRQDLYPEEVEAGIDPPQLSKTFEAFLSEANRLRSRYEGEIQLLVGLETENINDDFLLELEDLVRRCGDRIDYVVGSVHHVNEIPIDFDRKTFDEAVGSFRDSFPSSTSTGSKATESDGETISPPSNTEPPLPLLACVKEYFSLQYNLLQRFQPEVIGHFDLIRIFEPTLRLSPPAASSSSSSSSVDSSHRRVKAEIWESIERNVKFGIGYGALFEVNAKAFGKGWDTAYPGRDVLQLILSNGGRLTISDDAHSPSAVGKDYLRVREYLLEEGVRELWYLERIPTGPGDTAKETETAANGEGGLLGTGRRSRKTVARRWEGNWWEDGFWDGLQRAV